MSCAAKHRGSPWLEKFKLKKGSQLGKKTQFKKGELSGINNPLWKEEKAGYHAKHIWVNNNFGKPRFCEHCKTSANIKYEWANISKKYLRDRNDWLRLCVPCHHKYDFPEDNQKTFHN